MSVISKLDKKIRREYDTALEVFPQLVRKETKILDFLRTVDYDAPKAAMRLVMYWKLRKSMFKERWLLPMTQVRISCFVSVPMCPKRRGNELTTS